MNADRVKEVLRQTQQQLLPISKEESLWEAKLLVSHVLRCSVGNLSLLWEQPLSNQQAEMLSDVLERRMTGEPLQYILGEWEFMGLPLDVAPGVLIPRQDTETLAEHALQLAKDKGYHSVLDLCCGSGCVGIALAKLGGLQVTAVDISDVCLHMTGDNATKNGVTVTLLHSDLFEHVTDRFDMIVCNPPYLTLRDMEHLQKEVSFEPQLALYGGIDGLDMYRRIAKDYRAYLNSGGALVLEVGATQAEAVRQLLGGGYTVKDIAGICRVVCLI